MPDLPVTCPPREAESVFLVDKAAWEEKVKVSMPNGESVLKIFPQETRGVGNKEFLSVLVSFITT